MNTRAKRLALPLGGALVATTVVGASLATTAEAAPDRKTVSLASKSGATKVAGKWTAARLKAAKHYTDGSSASGKFKTSRKASADGSPGLISPDSSNRSAGRSKNVNLPTTVGRVFFEVNGRPYYCSASAVESKYANLVATAGHCVYDTDQNTAVRNFVFIPGYHEGKANWGYYVGAQMHTHYDFANFEDYDRDYAFVNVYNGIKREGRRWVDAGRLSDNVGGQGFAWNQKVGANVYVFGYPTAAHPDGDRVYTGETMKFCYGKTYYGPAVPKYKVEEGVAVKCAFTPGSSGGPFIKQYSNTKRVGYLNGVVSLAIDSDDNNRYDRISSPYFDGETAAIYKYASNLWTGKLPGVR
ncbi:trypsin-like peptidase domain-containing protein [Spongiactinospora sp. TRM90649]|uniref:trypsin-like serine peptidase n=1 Tax=Spongiactinospora sp. TRM90649 TaxID=3031114 RepID=UPI0023F712F9|nr:trypsin-like peptidase domain-containing protein [Spongiactinospora sp. TRM90649]MDF5753234.1 trypsin-like peptidase domain-containing protein [Spongiactinospora sp. TRM90649]